MNDVSPVKYDYALIKKAYSTALDLHDGQFRKESPIPYIVHPQEVAIITMRMLCPTEVVCAAYLHDTVEETRYQLDNILAEFGPEVHRLVAFCTEDKGIKDKKDSWQDRKQTVIDRARAARMDELELLLADKYCSLRSFQREYGEEGPDFWNRFNASSDEQHWFFSNLSRIFAQRLPSPSPSTRFINSYNRRVLAIWPHKI